MPEKQKVRHAIIRDGKTEIREVEMHVGTKAEAVTRRARIIEERREIEAVMASIPALHAAALALALKAQDAEVRELAAAVAALLRLKRAELEEF